MSVPLHSDLMNMFFEDNVLPMWIYDVNTLQILAVNHAAVSSYGYSREQFLASSILDLRIPSEAARLQRVLQEERDALSDACTWQHLRADGTPLDVRVQSHSITFSNVAARLIIAQDITEEMQLKRELGRALEAERKARLEAQQERTHLQELFAMAPALIAVTAGPRHRFIEANPAYLEFIGRSDLVGLELRKAFPAIAGSKVEARLDHVFETGEPYSAFEEPLEVSAENVQPIYRNLIYKAVYSADGEISGVFIMAHDVTELVRSRRQLREHAEQLELAHEELSVAYDRTIEGWARALDLKDHDTEGHSRRVTELTYRLAATLGMPEGDLKHVWRGALLHDIGKIGIPESILKKPGPLDDEEWVVMKRHPQLAGQVLRDIPYLQPALDIPLYHHERWNGSGYPNGLAGTDIPLAARIFAVVDVYDALVSERPYRSALTREKALEIICEQAGTLLDPNVVRAFLKIV